MQSSVGKEELRWSVQNMPVQEWRGTQRESLGDVLCVSKVKLQHLPFQVGHTSGEQPPVSVAQRSEWMGSDCCRLLPTCWSNGSTKGQLGGLG